MSLLQLAPLTPIAEHIVNWVNELNPSVNPLIEEIIRQIRYPKNPKTADFQFNLKVLHKYGVHFTNEFVLSLIERITDDKLPFLTNIEHESGFLSFSMDQEEVTEYILTQVVDQGSKYGQKNLGKGKVILIEFSSPNIAKPFHIGHLRSTILGNFLQNLHKALGYNVTSINYLGDWGKQYGLMAVAYRLWGSKTELETDAISHLYQLYIKVNQESNSEIESAAQDFLQKMEQGDTEALKLWSYLKEQSMYAYQKIYKRLGIHFDIYSGESQTLSQNSYLYQKLDSHLYQILDSHLYQILDSHLYQILDKLKEKDLLTTDEKGQFVDLSAECLGHAVMLKSYGTTMYLTRDLGEALRRWENHKFEKSLYVVGMTQRHHFQQFNAIIEKLDLPFAKKCQHVEFGNVLGMSTRKGSAIFLEEILNEAQQKMLTTMSDSHIVQDRAWTADQLGISAIIIQDFHAKRLENYQFEWKRMTASKGTTGPYLQYAHARVSSIIRTVASEIQLNYHANLRSCLVETEAYLLVKEIGKYSEILEKCLETYEPVYLVSYLMDLAKAIAVAHLHLRVKGEKHELAEARLLLFWCAQTVLHSGLKLLGITPIDSM